MAHAFPVTIGDRPSASCAGGLDRLGTVIGLTALAIVLALAFAWLVAIDLLLNVAVLIHQGRALAAALRNSIAMRIRESTSAPKPGMRHSARAARSTIRKDGCR